MNRAKGYMLRPFALERCMTFLDDDRPKKATAQPGENLNDLSVDEIAGRIQLYRDEIARLEQEMKRKQASLQAAQQFFR
jgi:uncharacterized small protein (DUF1192 family)